MPWRGSRTVRSRDLPVALCPGPWDWWAWGHVGGKAWACSQMASKASFSLSLSLSQSPTPPSSASPGYHLKSMGSGSHSDHWRDRMTQLRSAGRSASQGVSLATWRWEMRASQAVPDPSLGIQEDQSVFSCREVPRANGMCLPRGGLRVSGLSVTHSTASACILASCFFQTTSLSKQSVSNLKPDLWTRDRVAGAPGAKLASCSCKPRGRDPARVYFVLERNQSHQRSTFYFNKTSGA